MRVASAIDQRISATGIKTTAYDLLIELPSVPHGRLENGTTGVGVERGAALAGYYAIALSLAHAAREGPAIRGRRPAGALLTYCDACATNPLAIDE